MSFLSCFLCKILNLALTCKKQPRWHLWGIFMVCNHVISLEVIMVCTINQYKMVLLLFRVLYGYALAGGRTSIKHFYSLHQKKGFHSNCVMEVMYFSAYVFSSDYDVIFEFIAISRKKREIHKCNISLHLIQITWLPHIYINVNNEE